MGSKILVILVNEKQEISRVFRKFSRDVLIYFPLSSFLSEWAIECTIKSILPHLSLINS